MSENVRLEKDLIKEPQLWRLALRIEKTMLHAVLFNTIEDNSLIYRKISLDAAAPSQLKAIEDAIYENPLLLSDFARVDCVIDTDCFMVVPPEITSTEVREKIMSEAFPDFDGEIVACTIADGEAVILMGLAHEFAGFLRRTFNNPRLHHHLSPLCKYFFHKSRHGVGNTAKMYAILRAGKVDVIVVGCDSLKMANTFIFRDPMDAVYYILSCRQQLGMNSTSDEMFLAGSPSARESVAPTLRQYLSYVMPVIFPSEMFKAGKEAMKAPFDLIVLPLCE